MILCLVQVLIYIYTIAKFRNTNIPHAQICKKNHYQCSPRSQYYIPNYWQSLLSDFPKSLINEYSDQGTHIVFLDMHPHYLCFGIKAMLSIKIL